MEEGGRKLGIDMSKNGNQPVDVDGYVYPTDLDNQDELPLELPDNLMTTCLYNAAEWGVEVVNGTGTIIWKRTSVPIKKRVVFDLAHYCKRTLIRLQVKLLVQQQWEMPPSAKIRLYQTWNIL